MLQKYTYYLIKFAKKRLSNYKNSNTTKIMLNKIFQLSYTFSTQRKYMHYM